MSNINSVVMSGYVGEYINLKTTNSGLKILEFSFANERYKGGKSENKTTWWKAVIFGNRANSLEEYINKGTFVIVSGAIDKNKYKDKKDKWVSHTSIIVNEIEFKNKNKQPKNVSSNKTTKKGRQDTNENYREDDIPF